jgi:hypothetical protein
MNMKMEPDSNKDCGMHTRSTCPKCQKPIRDGENMILCVKCGSPQHRECWDENRGCASYYCDSKVSADLSGVPEQITISKSDLENVLVPPVFTRTLNKSREPLGNVDNTPEKFSSLVIASFVLALLSVPGISGVILERKIICVIGFSMAIISMLMGIISLVRINMGGKLRGGWMAMTTVAISFVMIILYLAMIELSTKKLFSEKEIDLKMTEIPSEDILKSLPLGKMRALKANVAIKCILGGKFLDNVSFGSGVVTGLRNNKIYIITNKHVIGVTDHSKKVSGNNITVKFYNGDETTAEIEWLAPGDIDIAVISAGVMTMKQCDNIQLLNGILSPSTQVFAVGNPMNYFWSYTEGVVSSVRNQQIGEIGMQIYQTQTPINQGNSGGGLYSMDGVLIGINTWTLNKSFTEGLNFSISTKSIISLLGDEVGQFVFSKNPEEKDLQK